MPEHGITAAEDPVLGSALRMGSHPSGAWLVNLGPGGTAWPTAVQNTPAKLRTWLLAQLDAIGRGDVDVTVHSIAPVRITVAAGVVRGSAWSHPPKG